MAGFVTNRHLHTFIMSIKYLSNLENLKYQSVYQYHNFIAYWCSVRGNQSMILTLVVAAFITSNNILTFTKQNLPNVPRLKPEKMPSTSKPFRRVHKSLDVCAWYWPRAASFSRTVCIRAALLTQFGQVELGLQGHLQGASVDQLQLHPQAWGGQHKEVNTRPPKLRQSLYTHTHSLI